MSTKKKPAENSMDALKITVPASTGEWFRNKALKEGVTIQSLVAPILNAVARGEIKQEFLQVA